jgi:uncharacterized protein
MSSRHPGLGLACVLCLPAPAVVVSQQPAKAPVDPANLVLAHHLLQAMHYAETMVANIDSAMAEQRRHNTQLPAVFYDSLLVRLKRTAPEVVDSLAPGYARRFTGSELEATIRFFESPAGRSFAQQQAGLSVEATQFGQRWGARVAAALMKDLVDAGIDITNH